MAYRRVDPVPPPPLRLRVVATAAAFAFATVVPRQVRADGEAWAWVENRVPIVQADAPGFPRLDWRIFTDFRANGRSGGLAQAFLRTGPLLYATNWLFIATHGTMYSDRLATGRHDIEARFEFEPNLFGRVGDFTFNDRNRVEARFRQSGERFRYRNQLRVSYAPKGARWIPFAWDEVLVDLSGLGANQNRAQVGLGRMLSETTRLDVGYMFRSREENDTWSHDHILNVSLFIDAPKPTPARL